jgi:hypothetical protein
MRRHAYDRHQRHRARAGFRARADGHGPSGETVSRGALNPGRRHYIKTSRASGLMRRRACPALSAGKTAAINASAASGATKIEDAERRASPSTASSGPHRRVGQPALVGIPLARGPVNLRVKGGPTEVGPDPRLGLLQSHPCEGSRSHTLRGAHPQARQMSTARPGAADRSVIRVQGSTLGGVGLETSPPRRLADPRPYARRAALFPPHIDTSAGSLGADGWVPTLDVAPQC